MQSLLYFRLTGIYQIDNKICMILLIAKGENYMLATENCWTWFIS